MWVTDPQNAGPSTPRRRESPCQLRPASLVARWLSTWPSGAGVAEEGPQPSPGGGPPCPGLHVSTSQEDLAPGDLGPATLDPRVSGCPAQHVQGSEPGPRGRPGGQAHGEAQNSRWQWGQRRVPRRSRGPGGAEPRPWPRPCARQGRGSASGVLPCTPAPRGGAPAQQPARAPSHEHKVQGSKTRHAGRTCSPRWTPARRPRAFLSAGREARPAPAPPRPGPRSRAIPDGRPARRLGLPGNSAATGPQARAVTNAAPPSRAVDTA